MSEEVTENAGQAVDVDALRAALKAANAEAASNRIKANELEAKLADASSAGDKFKSAYISTRIANALSEQGASNPKIGRLLDLSKIDVDDAGELVGLDEQLPGIKEEFPEMFSANRRAPNIDAADRPKVKAPLTSAQRLLKQSNG